MDATSPPSLSQRDPSFTTNMSTPDYAAQLGFHSVAAPIAFAILYLPFCGWFFLQLIRRFTHANVALAMFCQSKHVSACFRDHSKCLTLELTGPLIFFHSVRIVAYVIRAILANSDSAGQNLGLVIADEILLGVGFLGLLLTAYLLVNERCATSLHVFCHRRRTLSDRCKSGCFTWISQSRSESHDSREIDGSFMAS